jgi:hypothetical protein
MRYFDHPTIVNPSQTWLLELLPKRICGPLAGGPKEPAQGWGISFEEGWDWAKIELILFLLFFLGSFVFAMFWTVFKNDVRGAFGVAGWWISVATLLFGYIATRPDNK